MSASMLTTVLEKEVVHAGFPIQILGFAIYFLTENSSQGESRFALGQFSCKAGQAWRVKQARNVNSFK